MNRAVRGLLIAAGAVGAILVPLLLPTSAHTAFTFMVLAAIVATGLCLLMGSAGQVSLGQGAFFGVGAIAAGSMASVGVPQLIALAAAPLIAASAAAVIGAPLLRLRGHYLAFGTLAVHVILITMVANLDVFGGVYGIQGIPQLGIGPFELRGSLSYAYVALAALAVVILLTANLVRSRFGRGLRALAASESMAAASGVPVFRYKVAAFTISAAFAGIAGGIMAFFVGYVGSTSFPISLSIQVLVMAAVGGLVTVWGGVVGAVALTILIQALTTISTLPGMPATAPAVLSYAGYAVVLVAALLFLPHGIVPAVGRLLTRLRTRRSVA